MSIETPGASDQEPADHARLAQGRQATRLMTYAGAALAVLGVAIMFLPSKGSPHFMQIIGALVIVGGAFTLGWAGYMRRRFR
jgi:drug/metabolite transporter (DMT)-like permease